MNAPAIFAAAALAITPAIAMAQDAKPEQANPFAEGALQTQLPASGCTSDGFTEEGGVTIALSASDVKRLGEGSIEEGVKKLDIPAIRAELTKAWKAFTAEMTSADLAGTEPSEKVVTTLSKHLDAFVEAETKATGVHFAVTGVGLGAPTPGCQP